METTDLSKAAYWKRGPFTQFPNDVLGWLVHSDATEHEIKVVLFITRLSRGFQGRNWTNRRLDLDDFASELKCDRSTACRAVNSLLKRRRIFRRGAQGDHHFYGLYSPRATRDGGSATPHDPNATPHAQAATPLPTAVAAVQRSSGESERISSVIERVTATIKTTNMQPAVGDAKKALNPEIKESFKGPSAGSAAASAGAAASPASDYDPSVAYTYFDSQSALEMALRLRCAPKIRQRVKDGLVTLAPGVTLPSESSEERESNRSCNPEGGRRQKTTYYRLKATPPPLQKTGRGTEGNGGERVPILAFARGDGVHVDELVQVSVLW